MGVGNGLYMYDVVVKSSRSLSHLLMSSCLSQPRICVMYCRQTSSLRRRRYHFGGS